MIFKSGAMNVIIGMIVVTGVLLSHDGDSKLEDFGLAVVLAPGARMHAHCAPTEHIPPEVSLHKDSGKSVDWWTLGILNHEMVVGRPPLCEELPTGTYQDILAGKVYSTKHFDKKAKTPGRKVWAAVLSKRYGNLMDGHGDNPRTERLSGKAASM